MAGRETRGSTSRKIAPFRLKRALIVTVILILGGCLKSHPAGSVKIAAVGDTNGYKILEASQNQEDPLTEVRNLLRNEDVFIQNFEGVLIPEPPLPGTCPKQIGQSSFYILPRIADFLHPAQQTIATLANNHILDCGILGIEETVSGLADRGISAVGAGANSERACEPVRVQVNGVRLAILAYLAMPDPDLFSAWSGRAGAASWEECKGERQVGDLAASGYVVVVALHLHLGREWTDQSLPAHVALVQRVLAAGANVVIAHGPHVPQGVLKSHGGIALLSLGNFLFHPDYRMREKAHRSIIAELRVSSEKIELTIVPLRLDDSGRPTIPTSSDASWILKDIADLSARFGTALTVGKGIGYVTIQRQR